MREAWMANGDPNRECVMECKYCGKPTEIAIGGEPICEECYQNAGSCCLEFGGDDLWEQREAEDD